MLSRKFFEAFVDRKQLIILGWNRLFCFLQINALVLTAVALRSPPPCAVDENPAHSFSRHGKEVGTIFKLPISCADQLQPGFVNKRCGLERLTRTFLSHFVSCQTPQFLVNEIE